MARAHLLPTAGVNDEYLRELVYKNGFDLSGAGGGDGRRDRHPAGMESALALRSHSSQPAGVRDHDDRRRGVPRAAPLQRTAGGPGRAAFSFISYCTTPA